MSIRNIGKAPIEGDNPAGINLSDDITYDALQTEMDKLTSLSSTEGIDWELVKKLGTEITETKSKNMVVLTWLSISMTHTGGFPGFIDSLYLMNDAVQTYWDSMFPPKKRMRGRLNAINWWIDKTDALFETLPRIRLAEIDYNDAVDQFKQFDSFLGDCSPDAPILRSLIDKFSDSIDIITDVPSAEPEKAPTTDSPPPASPQKTATVTPQQHTSAPEISLPSPEISGENPSDVIKQALHLIGEASNAISKVAPLNPLTFKLNRLIAWANVTSLPPSNDNETMIPSPDEQFIDVLKTLHDSANWEALLNASESRVGQYLFWLDLSYYSATALQKMGKSAESKSIAKDTAEYIENLSGIEKLCFSGGIPFASHATKQWIKDTYHTSKDHSSGDNGKNEEQTDIDTTYEKASKMIENNQVDDALNLFQDRLSRAPSERSKLLWMAGMCKLLEKADKGKVAFSYYDEMEFIIDKFNLTQWEPFLAVETLSTIADGLEDGIRKQKLVNKIALISPTKAFEYL